MGGVIRACMSVVKRNNLVEVSLTVSGEAGLTPEGGS